MIKQPMLNKVFLALRTNFIPELKSEHVTLAYFYTIRWDALLDIAERYDNQLPATIHLGEKMQWESDGGEYYGFSVGNFDSTILSHLKMPHITVPKPMWDNLKPIEMDTVRVQVMDRLYVGKRSGNQLIWATIKNNQIGPGNAAINWESIRNTELGEPEVSG